MAEVNDPCNKDDFRGESYGTSLQKSTGRQSVAAGKADATNTHNSGKGFGPTSMKQVVRGAVTQSMIGGDGTMQNAAYFNSKSTCKFNAEGEEKRKNDFYIASFRQFDANDGCVNTVCPKQGNLSIPNCGTGYDSCNAVKEHVQIPSWPTTLQPYDQQQQYQFQPQQFLQLHQLYQPRQLQQVPQFQLPQPQLQRVHQLPQLQQQARQMQQPQYLTPQPIMGINCKSHPYNTSPFALPACCPRYANIAPEKQMNPADFDCSRRASGAINATPNITVPGQTDTGAITTSAAGAPSANENVSDREPTLEYANSHDSLHSQIKPIDQAQQPSCRRNVPDEATDNGYNGALAKRSESVTRLSQPARSYHDTAIAASLLPADSQAAVTLIQAHPLNGDRGCADFRLYRHTDYYSRSHPAAASLGPPVDNDIAALRCRPQGLPNDMAYNQPKTADNYFSDDYWMATNYGLGGANLAKHSPEKGQPFPIYQLENHTSPMRLAQSQPDNLQTCNRPSQRCSYAPLIHQAQRKQPHRVSPCCGLSALDD